MNEASKRRHETGSDPVRVLGRGLRAQRGVHLTLRALREGAGKTQVEVRDMSRIDQADISRLEGRESFDEYQLSTLQRYIAALGGRLELVAAFGDKRIIIAGAQSTRLADAPADRALARPEYDLSRRGRGKYAGRLARGTNVVVLAPDLAGAFKTSKAVNEALRSQLKRKSTPRRGG
jgi:hypothetical protein